MASLSHRPTLPALLIYLPGTAAQVHYARPIQVPAPGSEQGTALPKPDYLRTRRNRVIRKRRGALPVYQSWLPSLNTSS